MLHNLENKVKVNIHVTRGCKSTLTFRQGNIPRVPKSLQPGDIHVVSRGTNFSSQEIAYTARGGYSYRLCSHNCDRGSKVLTSSFQQFDR